MRFTNEQWKAAEEIVRNFGSQELYKINPDLWGAYTLWQDEEERRKKERAAWLKRDEERRKERAWAAITGVNQFEIWHDSHGQLLWKGSMREQLFKPVRHAFEILTERGANLERLLGKNVLRISDVPQSGLSNPDARAECDQIHNHIKCGPGSNLETILHELGHAVEYNLRPETVMARHRKSQPGVVRVEACSIPADSDSRFKELDEEFERAKRQEMAPISQYGLTNLTEWFGEAFMQFYAKPMHLREMGPKSFLTLERLTR
jgi:hypothetical protein